MYPKGITTVAVGGHERINSTITILVNLNKFEKKG